MTKWLPSCPLRVNITLKIRRIPLKLALRNDLVLCVAHLLRPCSAFRCIFVGACIVGLVGELILRKDVIFVDEIMSGYL